MDLGVIDDQEMLQRYPSENHRELVARLVAK